MYARVHNTAILPTMASIGVRELRAALSTFVKRAQSGERIVVTVDGHPVAQLAAVSPDVAGVSIDDLVARGAVIAPRRRGDFVPATPLALATGARIDRALREIRS